MGLLCPRLKLDFMGYDGGGLGPVLVWTSFEGTEMHLKGHPVYENA
jgi:hypothetical protein